MKKRKSAIAAFMLVVVLCLGVGFAALTDDLFVDGNLNWSFDDAKTAFDADVYFADPAVEENFVVTGTCEKAASITATRAADKNSNANDKLTITVAGDAFSSAGQVATIKAKVQNDSTDAVNVAVKGTATANTSTQGLFKVEVAGTTEAIAAGESGEITITITLLKTAAADVTGETFSFELTATSAK